MAPLEYVVLRLIRRWLPEPLVQYLKQNGVFLHAGRETVAPLAAVERYESLLEPYRVNWKDATVFILGYGGFFGVAVEILRRGASHVVLCDPFAPPNNKRNRTLLPQYAPYLVLKGNVVLPNPEYITLLHESISTDAAKRLPQADIVLSSSVYEHIAGEEVEPTTRALAALTADNGVNLHIIDLRDHFFKYPFQMLTFSEATWRRWFNPTTNLNRWRLGDYRRVFENYFDDVAIHVMAREPEKFRQALPHIRPEFLTGDEAVDAVTLVALVARSPRRETVALSNGEQ